MRETRRTLAALGLCAALATGLGGCATDGRGLVIGVGVADLLSSTTLQLCRDGVIQDERICAAATATAALTQAVFEPEQQYWTRYLDGLDATGRPSDQPAEQPSDHPAE